MEKNQYDHLKRDIQTITQSKPAKVVLLVGGALITLLLVSGVFRVLTVFFQNYNTMNKAYYGK
jgi:hypothetical protein